MHDSVWFETQGIPTVFVASSEFAAAAAAQATHLGLEEVRRVLVPHPIQDATDDELQRKADDAFDAVLGALKAATD